jgi:hypothetical protein
MTETVIRTRRERVRRPRTMPPIKTFGVVFAVDKTCIGSILRAFLIKLPEYYDSDVINSLEYLLLSTYDEINHFTKYL